MQGSLQTLGQGPMVFREMSQEMIVTRGTQKKSKARATMAPEGIYVPYIKTSRQDKTQEFLSQDGDHLQS